MPVYHNPTHRPCVVFWGLMRMGIDSHQSMRMRAKLMVEFDPCGVPSSSRVLEGGEPARTVAVKKSVKGFFRGTVTALPTEPSGRISSRRFSETDLPAAFEPLTKKNTNRRLSGVIWNRPRPGRSFDLWTEDVFEFFLWPDERYSVDFE